MAKRKREKNAQNNRKPAIAAITKHSPTKHSPNSELAHNIDRPTDSSKTDGYERYRRKQLRREVIDRFLRLKSSAAADLNQIVSFLSHYSDEVDLVRESLQPYKKLDDPWSVGIWRILVSEDPTSELTGLLAKQQEAIDSHKRFLLRSIPDPLIVQLDTTSNGPVLIDVSAAHIDALVRQRLPLEQREHVLFTVDTAGLVFSVPGQYRPKLVFTNGDAIPINVRIELKLDAVPSGCESAWKQVDLITIASGSNVVRYLEEFFSMLPLNDFPAWYLGATRILKTAYVRGYWKAPWVQKVLEEWKRRTRAVPSLADDAKASAPEKHSPELSEKTGTVEMLNKDEEEKLSILNLPPLVANDLKNASVDFNALQRLFLAPSLRHLRGKRIEDFTTKDISRACQGINKGITNLRDGEYGSSVPTRTLAMILLSLSRLQLDRLEIGTSESSIRFCLSGYSARMGEYLIDQHSRYDSARDYYLEAITLNLNSHRNADFPTMWLFESWFSAGRRRLGHPNAYLQLLSESVNDPKILRRASRTFMELGERDYPYAEQWFEKCSGTTKRLVVAAICEQLELGEQTFSHCVAAYKQAMGHVRALLDRMRLCSSSQGIMDAGSELLYLLDELDWLLSSTNRKNVQLFIESATAVRGFFQSKTYEDKRSYVNSATELLQQVLDFKSDYHTALWAAYFNQTAETWLRVVRTEFLAIAQDIAPVLNVSLAERSVTLGDDKRPRVIYRVENTGAGTADPVNVRFHSVGSEFRAGLPSLRDFRLEPLESVENYFNLESYADGRPVLVDYEFSYYDLDRKLHEGRSGSPLIVQPLQKNERLAHLSNPFRTDKEVDDERMFVGRASLLNEVFDYGVKEQHGGLLMLHGQKRVGKSSLLLFLERRIDQLNNREGVLAVRVSWLDFSAHAAVGVIEELITSIQNKCRQIFGIEIAVPPRSEIQASYSLALNDILRGLESRGIARLVLLVDEFDVVVHQLDRQAGYDRMFFEYLRGLSKRGSVALVLTGGEMMPLLFDRLGDVFNHDKTWRIEYLSPTDGSVENLVNNEYIKDCISFSEDAILTIKEVTACNPFFIQMLCQEAVERSRQQVSAEVCKFDIKEVSDWLVRRSSTTKYVRHLYSPLLEPDPIDLAVIGITAEEETRGHRPRFVHQDQIIERIQEPYRDRAINKIGELVRREILTRNPDSADEIRVMLPLFRDWFNDNKAEYNLWVEMLRR